MADAKPQNPEPVLSVAAPESLYALALDLRSGLAYVGGSEGTVFSVDLNASTPAIAARWHEDSYIAALALLDDGPHRQTLIVARYDGSLTWLDPHDGRSIRRIERAHDGWIRDFVALADGARLATVGHDMLLKVWDAQSGALLHTLSGHAAETPQGYVSAVYAVAATPDGRVLATGDRVGEIRLWNLDPDKPFTGPAQWRAADFYTFDPDKRDRSIGGIRRLRFSPDGSRLAVAGIAAVSNVDGFVGPNRLEIWDWQAGKREAVLQDAHQAVLNDVLWSADGQYLTAAGGGDAGGAIVAWRIAGEQLSHKVKHKGHIQRLAWLDGGRFVSAGFESVQLWDPTTWPAAAK